MSTQTWDPLAYGKNAAFVHRLASGVLEWLAPKSAEHILDIGCGDGQLTERIAANGAVVVGIDSSPEMVAATRELGITAVEASAESLPFKDQVFDAVFSNAALHWVRDHDATMSEVRRVLKPGGRFVAEMGGHGNVAAIRVALTAVLAIHNLGDPAHWENFFPTTKDYADRLARHGFQVQQIALMPRPTLLAESGMAGWLRTFRRGVLDELPPEMRDSVVDETVALLAPFLCDDEGNWTADYVRLRFIATV